MKNLLSMLENLFVAVTFAESGEYQAMEISPACVELREQPAAR